MHDSDELDDEIFIGYATDVHWLKANPKDACCVVSKVFEMALVLKCRNSGLATTQLNDFVCIGATGPTGKMWPHGPFKKLEDALAYGADHYGAIKYLTRPKGFGALAEDAEDDTPPPYPSRN